MPVLRAWLGSSVHVVWSVPFKQEEYYGYGAISSEVWCDDTQAELSGASEVTGNLTYLPSFSSQANSSLAVFQSCVSLLFFSCFCFFLFPSALSTLLFCPKFLLLFLLYYAVEVKPYWYFLCLFMPSSCGRLSWPTHWSHICCRVVSPFNNLHCWVFHRLSSAGISVVS